MSSQFFLLLCVGKIILSEYFPPTQPFLTVTDRGRWQKENMRRKTWKEVYSGPGKPSLDMGKATDDEGKVYNDILEVMAEGLVADFEFSIFYDKHWTYTCNQPLKARVIRAEVRNYKRGWEKHRRAVIFTIETVGDVPPGIVPGRHKLKAYPYEGLEYFDHIPDSMFMDGLAPFRPYINWKKTKDW